MEEIKPKWIIFDVGGVLYHFEKALTEAAQHSDIPKEILLQALIRNIEEVEVSKKYYKEHVKEALDTIQNAHKLEDILPLLFNLNNYLQDTRLLIRQLYQADFSLAILTNAWHGVTEEMTSAIDEFHLFRFVFDSTIMKMRKPAKEVFLHVEKTLDVKGGEIFFIDDSLQNIQAAQEFSWQVFHYSLGDDEGRTSNDQIRKLLLYNH